MHTACCNCPKTVSNFQSLKVSKRSSCWSPPKAWSPHTSQNKPKLPALKLSSTVTSFRPDTQRDHWFTNIAQSAIYRHHDTKVHEISEVSYCPPSRPNRIVISPWRRKLVSWLDMERSDRFQNLSISWFQHCPSSSFQHKTSFGKGISFLIVLSGHMKERDGSKSRLKTINLLKTALIHLLKP